jgi:hypothetical protein
MSGKLAIVFCVHHKPWLMMSTLLTLVSQHPEPADLFFAYNVGDGNVRRESYREYYELAARADVNVQLSPFDERVREVCQVRGWNIREIEYENDHGLDSGCWYKFIRDGYWRDYEYVLFIHEGMLLADPMLLTSLLAFVQRREVHFVASGHEKRRVPRALVAVPPVGHPDATEMDEFHREMVEETFRIFCRDPEFAAVYRQYGSDFAVETEHHVPGAARGGVWQRRLRARLQKQWGSPYTHPDVAWPADMLRRAPHVLDRVTSRVRIMTGSRPASAREPLAYIGGGYELRPFRSGDEVETQDGVTYHRVEGPEWFGCATNHLLSRAFLQRFSDRLNQYEMFEMLDLPFAGSALEAIWGMLPAWLGVDKWFTNGFHRVRKHFSTYRREDYPPEMASYINRYHRGRLVVAWEGDYLKLKAWHASLGDVRRTLPAVYF